MSRDAANDSWLRAGTPRDPTNGGIARVGDENSSISGDGEPTGHQQRIQFQIELRASCESAITERSGFAAAGDGRESCLTDGNSRQAEHSGEAQPEQSVWLISSGEIERSASSIRTRRRGGRDGERACHDTGRNYDRSIGSTASGICLRSAGRGGSIT